MKEWQGGDAKRYILKRAVATKFYHWRAFNSIHGVQGRLPTWLPGTVVESPLFFFSRRKALLVRTGILFWFNVLIIWYVLYKFRNSDLKLLNALVQALEAFEGSTWNSTNSIGSISATTSSEYESTIWSRQSIAVFAPTWCSDNISNYNIWIVSYTKYSRDITLYISYFQETHVFNKNWRPRTATKKKIKDSPLWYVNSYLEQDAKKAISTLRTCKLLSYHRKMLFIVMYPISIHGREHENYVIF